MSSARALKAEGRKGQCSRGERCMLGPCLFGEILTWCLQGGLSNLVSPEAGRMPRAGAAAHGFRVQGSVVSEICGLQSDTHTARHPVTSLLQCCQRTLFRGGGQ